MQSSARPGLGGKVKVSAIAVIAASLVLGGATAAHAEGNFGSYMTQVQPSFTSRVWQDNNRDSASTVIKLSNCKVNKGGKVPGSTKLKSVKVSLTSGASKAKTLTQPCGSYNFGRVPAGKFNSFTIEAINGETQRGAKIFLNADVTVNY